MLTNSLNHWPFFLNARQPVAGIPHFSVNNVLGPTLKLFTSNLWLVTKIVFVVVAPYEIFRVLSLANPFDYLDIRVETLTLGAFCKPLIAPALMYALMKCMHTGVAPGVNESYRWGLTKLGKVIICSAIAYFLQGVGYVFLIIPGIIISLALAVVYPVAVLERRSIPDVLRRSSELTRGYRFEIAIAECILWLMMLTITIPASYVSANAGAWPLAVLAAIIKDVVEQAWMVLALVMYLSLVRTHHPRRPIVSLNQ
jgi:uncharacterized membrane protein